MQTQTANSFLWSTASFKGSPDSVRTELDALGAHFRRCNGVRGPWYSLQCLGDMAHGFIAPRFVTTLGLASIGFAVIATVL